MRCEQTQRMMSARLDGCLDRAAISSLRDHVASCSPCRAERQRMQVLDQLFRSAPMRAAPPHLHARVAARIERQEQARRAVIGSLALTLGATTVVVMAAMPLTLGLVDNLGAVPAVLTGGLQTITQLLALFDALSRIAPIVSDRFAVTLAIISTGSLMIALVLNGLWIAAMRKLHRVSR